LKFVILTFSIKSIENFSVPECENIDKRLKKEFQNYDTNVNDSFTVDDYEFCITYITQIMDMSKRCLLNVHSSDSDKKVDVSETIFNAIFKGNLIVFFCMKSD